MSDHWTPVYDSTSFVLSVFFPRSLRPTWFTSDASSPMSTFQPGKTPFSTGPVVFGTMALYLVTVLGGRELMQRFKVPPQELKKPFLGGCRQYSFPLRFELLTQALQQFTTFSSRLPPVCCLL